jgi:hypothetical protein
MNTKLLNKNYDSLENLSKTYFKKIDFLKRMTDKSPYQFMSKIPKFLKKINEFLAYTSLRGALLIIPYRFN